MKKYLPIDYAVKGRSVRLFSMKRALEAAAVSWLYFAGTPQAMSVLNFGIVALFDKSLSTDGSSY